MTRPILLHGRLPSRTGFLLLAALVTPVQAQQVPVTPLVSYSVAGDGIAAPLTALPGDPRRGRQAAANPSLGNCLICHRAPIAEAPAFGDVGPPLDGVGSRLGEAQLRLRLVDPRRLNPDSVMPAYYKVDGLQRVAPRYAGQPMLAAQDIEDIVAWLLTLRGQP